MFSLLSRSVKSSLVNLTFLHNQKQYSQKVASAMRSKKSKSKAAQVSTYFPCKKVNN